MIADDSVFPVPPAMHRRMRWRNGAGWTTELAVHPREGAFDWRISVAEVAADCDFSAFPDVDRSILVLAGEGMALAFPGAPEVVLRTGDAALAFPGERAARCRLLGGEIRDFNVMTRRSACTHSLTREALGGARPLDRAPDVTWFVYVAGGRAQLGDATFVAGDGLVVPASPEATATLRGAADLVLARLLRR